jgi:hypothetical protein
MKYQQMPIVVTAVQFGSMRDPEEHSPTYGASTIVGLTMNGFRTYLGPPAGPFYKKETLQEADGDQWRVNYIGYSRESDRMLILNKC